METPQKRLQHWIDKTFKSKSELAEILGVIPQALSPYTIGASVYGHKYLNKLKELGLNVDWYLTGEGDMLLPSEPSNVASEPQVVYPKRTNIELLPVPANAGKGYNFEPSSFSYEVPPAFSLERYKAIRISGDSMLPTIPDGSIVMFDTNLVEPAHDRIVIATVDGVLYCKRVMIDADNIRYLVSDNKEYETIKVYHVLSLKSCSCSA